MCGDVIVAFGMKKAGVLNPSAGVARLTGIHNRCHRDKCMMNRSVRCVGQLAVAAAALSFGAAPGALAAVAQPIKSSKPTPECFPLLVVTEGYTRVHFTLTRCDVALEFTGSPANPDLTLRMKEDVAAWWRELFRSPSLADDALARGQIHVMPDDTDSLPQTILFDSEKADTSEREMWVWNRRDGTLTAKNFHPNYYANWYRVCNGAERGASIFLSMPVDLPIGAIFSGSLIKSAPWGKPNGVPKQCAADWKLSAGAPAVIHPQWGLGMVSADAKDGERFTVQTRVGQTTLTKEVRVYSPKAHLLIGSWRQVGERACDAAASRKPAVPISEFHLRPDGNFDLTWVPRNHHYIDYRGTYVHRPDSGEFSWSITGGQAQPVDAGRSGTARINEQGQLVIAGLHPGSAATASGKLCEMVFEKYTVGEKN